MGHKITNYIHTEEAAIKVLAHSSAVVRAWTTHFLTLLQAVDLNTLGLTRVFVGPVS